MTTHDSTLEIVAYLDNVVMMKKTNQNSQPKKFKVSKRKNKGSLG
jgi:hypothetical protein